MEGVLMVYRRWIKSLSLLGTLVTLTASLVGCLFVSPLRAVIDPTPEEGAAPLPVTFDLSGSSGSIAGYFLEFGDGTSTQGDDVDVPVFHVYHDPGTYTATLTVWSINGRESTASAEIKVDYPPLTAALEADVTRGFAPLPVTFQILGEGEITSFTLDFGDGKTYVPSARLGPKADVLSDPVEHLYRDPGRYTATLAVRDRWGREATDSVEIEVLPSILRAILNASPQTGTAPLAVTFDLSETTGEVDRFVLDLGDGNIVEGGSAELNDPIVHTYEFPDIYTVTLTVYDVYGNDDSQSTIIYVEYPPLEASLEASPTSGTAPLEVTFDTSGTVGPIIYFVLDFGDGNMVSGNQLIKTVPHTYSSSGTYVALLQIVDVYGRSDQASVNIEVR